MIIRVALKVLLPYYMDQFFFIRAVVWWFAFCVGLVSWSLGCYKRSTDHRGSTEGYSRPSLYLEPKWNRIMYNTTPSTVPKAGKAAIPIKPTSPAQLERRECASSMKIKQTTHAPKLFSQCATADTTKTQGNFGNIFPSSHCN